jgi:hypothetical protein
MFTVIETPFFTRLVSDYWTEDERGAFAAWLAAHPEAGDVVPGSHNLGVRSFVITYITSGSGLAMQYVNARPDPIVCIQCQ